MNAIKTIVHELGGLVVDDVGFALAVVVWIALVWLLSDFILSPSPWVPTMFFVGLGTIVLESVMRRSRAAANAGDAIPPLPAPLQ
ncbi:hypothetical protein [Methylobacterium brachythecii]|uniref:Uncharacterized protein n=1 Tax=Methylobacterium brachythecii TaxID=1176177 RepID=A0A7W6APE1_9HYPH|nr:hypothetical protein [Methylobacterium brachythecii]MBB3905529.1 hypothetical protein [Methylobacterium brachythecii]GLS46254.1 hypothetical protein GCM10007884_42460 [Methylobacterium brachythecii]